MSRRERERERESKISKIEVGDRERGERGGGREGE